MKKLREKLRSIEEVVVKGEVGVAMFLVATMVVLSFAKMVMRNFIVAGWAVGFTEVVTLVLPHLILLLGFVGASIGITKREVIQMDVFRRLYPARFRKIWTFIAYIGIAAVCGVYVKLVIMAANPEIESEPLIRTWLMYGYMPTILVVCIKSILVLFNPQIEQELSDEITATSSN